MKRSALIVASDQYGDPKLKRLRSPSVDAAQLAHVLGDAAIGNFQVELSTNDTESVLRRKLSSFFTSASRDDLLVLHVACHGVKDDDGNLYFAATDTETDDLIATAVPAEFVERLMARSPSRHIVLLLDCCYSGAFTRGMRSRGASNVEVMERFHGRGRAVLTASSAMEYAWEGDEISGDGLPSVFTGAVVRGLETGEADRDGDGQISVDELYDFVLERVRDTNPRQTPNKYIQTEGELVIARSARGSRPPESGLPAELLQAVNSPFAGVREGAVGELAAMTAHPDERLRRAALVAVRGLAHDDSHRVSTTALAALAAIEHTAESEAEASALVPLASSTATSSSTSASASASEDVYESATRPREHVVLGANAVQPRGAYFIGLVLAALAWAIGPGFGEAYLLPRLAMPESWFGNALKVCSAKNTLFVPENIDVVSLTWLAGALFAGFVTSAALRGANIRPSWLKLTIAACGVAALCVLAEGGVYLWRETHCGLVENAATASLGALLVGAVVGFGAHRILKWCGLVVYQPAAVVALATAVGAALGVGLQWSIHGHALMWLVASIPCAWLALRRLPLT
ncbi:MAG TPA: caspase family protein, partial [Chloroflexota bacterium]|nr:caspase family protein [Chloroflexota bacterium]